MQLYMFFDRGCVVSVVDVVGVGGRGWLDSWSIEKVWVIGWYYLAGIYQSFTKYYYKLQIQANMFRAHFSCEALGRGFG